MTGPRGNDTNPVGVSATLDHFTEQRQARLKKGNAMHGGFTDKTLVAWEPGAQAAALWERAKHLQAQADYWKCRAESAEARMLAHHCADDTSIEPPPASPRPTAAIRSIRPGRTKRPMPGPSKHLGAGWNALPDNNTQQAEGTR